MSATGVGPLPMTAILQLHLQLKKYIHVCMYVVAQCPTTINVELIQYILQFIGLQCRPTYSTYYNSSLSNLTLTNRGSHFCFTHLPVSKIQITWHYLTHIFKLTRGGTIFHLERNSRPGGGTIFHLEQNSRPGEGNFYLAGTQIT